MSDEHHYPFPWRLMGVIAVIVAVSTVIAGLLLSRNSVVDRPVPGVATLTSAPVREPVWKHRQVTILLQVRDQERHSVSNVLFGVGGKTGYVSQLLLPRNLLLPSSPPIQLEDVDGPTGPISAQGPLQVLLGVQIDAALEMDRLAWAGLLDSIGIAPGDSHAAQPGSFPLVLGRVLSKLPSDQGDLGQLLTSLGSMARTTVTNGDASELLSVLGTNLREQPLKREVLPVTTLRAGPSQVDIASQPAAQETVESLFPLALLQPGHSGPIRVVIEPAGVEVGQMTAATMVLRDAGFGVVEQRNSGAQQQNSVVYVAGDSEDQMAQGRRVASLLGLTAFSVRADGSPAATVDVRVELGNAFRLE